MNDQPATAGDAEAALLGAAMSGYPNIDDLLAVVEPSDFYQPFHEEVWIAIGRVHAAGNQPDPISVRLALSSANVKHDPLRLHDLTQATPLIAQAPYYANQVVQASGRRRLQAAAIRIQQLVARDGADLDDLREDARREIDEATSGHATSRAHSVAEILPKVLDIAENGQSALLSTGWPDLDRLLGGLAPGRLCIVGARPGVGKSLMGTNLAVHFAIRHQRPVLFASIEMSEEEVLQRMLAKHARVNLTRLSEGRTNDSEWNLLASKVDGFRDMPCRIIDQPDQTVASIRREARNYLRDRDDLALIIVDYLQLMRVPDSKANRVEALGEVSRGLKLLARETGACVVAMAQVNRQATHREGGRPRSSDLRESGSIEADADQVILLHPANEDTGELEVIIDKNRHGSKGVATLEVQGHYGYLASVEWSPTRMLGPA